MTDFSVADSTDITIVVPVTDQSGVDVDISGVSEIEWSVADSVSGTKLLTKTFTGGDIEIQADNVSFAFEVNAPDTNVTLEGPGEFYHEALVTTSDGKAYTSLSGTMTVTPSLLTGDAEQRYIKRVLFGGGEDGALLVAEPQYLYTDAARTTLVSDPGDPVGGITDLSGNGNHGSQSADEDRPVYGVVPRGGRTNVLDYTEALDQWNSYGEVVVSPGIDDPDGGNNAFRLEGSDEFCRLPNTIDVPVEPNTEYTFKALARHISGGGANFRVYLAGAISSNVNVPTGVWGEVQISFTTGGGNFDLVQLRLDQVGEIIDIYHPQISKSPSDPYQRVVSQYEVTEAGVQSVHTLNFNYTNQHYNATLPAGTYTVALAGVNGIWFDEVTHAGGTFSVGPTTYTGGPDGILEVVGALVAFPAVEPVISEAKKARLVQYFKALGSPGEITLGPELVTNGTFDTGISGWSAINNAVIGWDASEAISVERQVSQSDRAVTALTEQLSPGDLVIAGFSINSGTGSGRIFFQSSTGTSDRLGYSTQPNAGASESVERVVEVSGDAGALGLGLLSNATRLFDNISVRKLVLPS